MIKLFIDTSESASQDNADLDPEEMKVSFTYHLPPSFVVSDFFPWAVHVVLSFVQERLSLQEQQMKLKGKCDKFRYHN